MNNYKAQALPMEYGGATGSAHPWHKRPRWQKRIYGWLCYQMHSWFALLFPEAADRIMYRALNDQFEDPSTSLLEFDPSCSDVWNACMSYRHDFGLLTDAEQKAIRFEAREWLRSWGHTLPQFATNCRTIGATENDGIDTVADSREECMDSQ